jgi:hypothetical protein
LSVDQTIQIEIGSKSWLDSLLEWWNSLPWWQKVLIGTGVAVGVVVPVGYVVSR